jgi:hypothetical protein
MLKHPSLDLPTNSKHMHRTLFFSLYAAGKKNISASDRERRDEEQRRSERKEDVVIGKTSAKKGASDYALDPKATEQEYLRQLSRQEQEIFHLTEQGMELLNSVGLCLCFFMLTRTDARLLILHFLNYLLPIAQTGRVQSGF